MNFKKMIASVSDSVKSIDFDFVAAGKTIVDTAKTAGDVLAEKGKEIKTHYEDVKAERASRPEEVKAESLEDYVAFCIDATQIAEARNSKEALKIYQGFIAEAAKNGGYVSIKMGSKDSKVKLEDIGMMPLIEFYNL